jgi:hypothetical protein
MQKGQIVQVLSPQNLDGARGRVEGFARDERGREIFRVVFELDTSPSGYTSFWLHADDLISVEGESITNITRIVEARERKHERIKRAASARKERKKHA